MHIDWFTVGAQALNFVILVWLMKRFLYQPILHAIDAREERIAAALADADSKMTEAEKQRTEYEQKNDEFEEKRKALMREATEDATAERQRLLEEAQEAAEALSVKRQEALRNEVDDMSRAIGRQTREEVFAIARQTLNDLATSGLEERMSEVFTRRLREMDGQEKARLGAALKTASDASVVRSAFDLPAPQRAAIKTALNETFSADVQVRFETAGDLISGIELAANGLKIAWSIDDYLGAMEKNIAALVGKDVLPNQVKKPEPVPVLQRGIHEHSA